MRIKKSGGKIFGAEFTAAEKKALDIEVKRQLAEYDKKHVMELVRNVLNDSTGNSPRPIGIFLSDMKWKAKENLPGSLLIR